MSKCCLGAVSWGGGGEMMFPCKYLGFLLWDSLNIIWGGNFVKKKIKNLSWVILPGIIAHATWLQGLSCNGDLQICIRDSALQLKDSGVGGWTWGGGVRDRYSKWFHHTLSTGGIWGEHEACKSIKNTLGIVVGIYLAKQKKIKNWGKKSCISRFHEHVT